LFGFLPAQGTVLSNPNGRILRSRFTGEPGFEKINGAHQTAGYQSPPFSSMNRSSGSVLRSKRSCGGPACFKPRPYRSSFY